MLPRIVRTLPESGAIGFGLTTPIEISFSGPLNWSALLPGNFQLLSLTSNTTVAITGLSVVQSTFKVTLTHESLASLNSYRLTVSGLQSAVGEVQSENYSFDFQTLAVAPANPPPAPLSVVFSYPRYGAQNIAPAVVRVRFSDVLDKASMNLDLTDADCAIRVIDLADYEEGEVISIAGDLDPVDLARDTDLVFQPTEVLPGGVTYIVLIQDVVAALPIDAEPGDLAATLDEYSFEFTSKFAYGYVSLADLLDIAPFLQAVVDSRGEAYFYRLINSSATMLVSQLVAAAVTYTADNVYFLDWIKADCIYQVLLGQITERTSGATTKTLADLTISYDRDMADLLELLNLWLSRRDKDYSLLAGTSSQAKAGSFVRGQSVDTAYGFMDRGMQSFDSSLKEW